MTRRVQPLDNPQPSLPPAADPHATPRPRPVFAAFLAMAVCALLISVALAAFSSPLYAREAGLDTLLLRDRFVIIWLLTAQPLLLLLPGISVVLLVQAASWRRSGWAIFLLTLLGVFGYLLIDLRVQVLTGNHLPSYFEIITLRNAAVWGGGATVEHDVVKTVIAIVTGALAFGAGTWWLATRTALTHWRFSRRTAVVVALAYASAAAGAVAARPAFSQPEQLGRLYAALPLDISRFTGGWLRPTNISDFQRALNATLRPHLTPLGDLLAPKPVDDTAAIDPAGGQPDILLIVLDSLRYNVLTPADMPRLRSYADRGLRLDHHWAGANVTECGMFTLLYARSSVQYDTTLDKTVPPQWCQTMAHSGYHRSLDLAMPYIGVIASNYKRIRQYLSAPVSFDDVAGFPGAMDAGDHYALRDIHRLLTEADAAPKKRQPRFIVTLLGSTHFDYYYPPPYGELHQPAAALGDFLKLRNNPHDRTLLINRYLNSVRFLDDEIGKLLDAIDLRHTIVIVTGDHGESLWEDGSIAHLTRASDVQMRVPCFLVGANIPVGVVTQWTRHTDLLPTLLHAASGHQVPLLHCQGDDLLAGELDRGEHMILSVDRAAANSFTFTLAAPKDRLQLRVSRLAPEVEVQGNVDIYGNLDPFHAPPLTDVAATAASLSAELDALAR